MRARQIFMLSIVSFVLLFAPGTSSAPAATSPDNPFEAGRVGFSIKVRDIISSYQVLGIFALPEEELKISVEGGRDDGPFRVECDLSLIHI